MGRTQYSIEDQLCVHNSDLGAPVIMAILTLRIPDEFLIRWVTKSGWFWHRRASALYTITIYMPQAQQD